MGFPLAPEAGTVGDMAIGVAIITTVGVLSLWRPQSPFIPHRLRRPRRWSTLRLRSCMRPHPWFTRPLLWWFTRPPRWSMLRPL